MRADALGIENASVLTPELDQLALEGTLFTGAYCASPVCTPSRSSIFTGRYPHVHGAWNIGTTLREDELTLCDHLKKADYETIGIGKMHFRPQMKGNFSQEYEEPAYRDRGRASDGTYYGFDEHHITEDNCIGEYMEWLRQRNPEVAERFSKDHYRASNAQNDVWESELLRSCIRLIGLLNGVSMLSSPTKPSNRYFYGPVSSIHITPLTLQKLTRICTLTLTFHLQPEKQMTCIFVLHICCVRVREDIGLVAVRSILLMKRI